MKIAFFDTHEFERPIFSKCSQDRYQISFIKARLEASTAALAADHDVVCSFVNDKLDRDVLQTLRGLGVRLIALRSAGYNHIDLKAAQEFGLPVVRVPGYSPNAIAEHAVTLMLNLNRKVHRAYNRVREMNFSLEGLVGFDMKGKTVGILGVGQIGRCAAQIFRGFGCQILLFDKERDMEFANSLNASYVSLEDLLRRSDIVSLHLPLTPETRHIVAADQFALMKPSSYLINTGRGGLIHSKSLIDALKHRQIAGVGLDVYEWESGIFFEDHSQEGIQDDLLARLLTFPNALITSHQGFLTVEALTHIAETTHQSLLEFEAGKTLSREVRA